MIRTAVVVAVMVAALGATGPSFASQKLFGYNPPAPLAPVCYGVDKAGKKIVVACPTNP